MRDRRKPIETRECLICKKMFIAYYVNDKCCSPECREERNRIVCRERDRKRRERAKKQEDKKIHNRNRLVEMAAEARRLGMTYGQYVAKKGG